MKKEKMVKTGALAAVLAMLALTGTALASDVATGTGDGVAYGTDSKATDATSTAVGKDAAAEGKNSVAIGFNAESSNNLALAVGVASKAKGLESVAVGHQAQADDKYATALGKGAHASKENGIAIGNSWADGKSSIAIGDRAIVNSNNYIPMSIAIGKNAHVLSSIGGQEYEFSFNKEAWIKQGFLHPSYTPKAGTDAVERIAGGIAIGTNAYARTGSVEIGNHTMQGKPMGGVDQLEGGSANLVNMTTIGTNSYNKGVFATIIGAYSINTGDFDGSGGFNTFLYGSQNMGSVLIGSLNQNRSKGKNGQSGIANSIIGIANIAENANGALIYGAANKITNSNENISGFDVSSGVATVDELVDKLGNGVSSSNAGGAVLAIGGANKADYAMRSQMIGVKNTLAGASGNYSENNLLNGVNNIGINIDNVMMFGTDNTVTDSKAVQLLGDKRKVTGGNKSVILGSTETETELAVSKATILGFDANVKAEGGVALGAGSILDDSESGLDVSGYDMATSTNSTLTTPIWRPTLAAVSVGVKDTDTRRITNVAAGINDTDAVNVAQLKQVTSSAGSSSTSIVAGDGIKVVKGTDGSWTISTNFTNSGSDEVSYKDGTASGNAGDSTQSGKAGFIETKVTADDNNTTSLGESGTLGIKGDNANITTAVSGSNVNVSLNKNIAIDSVTINNGPTINSNGIDMHNTKITNVADGDVSANSTDVVTGRQLFQVQEKMTNVDGRINRLGQRIDRVGAHAAALAALHPLEYDGDNKLDFATGTGFYRGNNAVAIGAFYRPNRNLMFSIGGSTGSGENMWNLGLSVKVGGSSEYANVSKAELVAINQELQANDQHQDQLIKEQQAKMAEQDQKIARLEAMVQKLMAQ